jgi:hypothetical protein
MVDRRHPLTERRLAFVLLVVCWVFCASNALNERIDRDEHMYLSAARLSTELRIYEDFAFLQTPYSVGVYRAVLALSPDPWTLLPARIFKTLVTASMIVLLFVCLQRLGARPLMAASLITLLYMTDLVRDMAAIARNYDLAQLSILAGLCIAPLRRQDPAGRGRLVLLGVFASVAIGFKLTYAPLAGVLLAWPLVVTGTGRLARAGWMALGAATGLAPAVATMVGIDPTTLRLNLLDYHFYNAEFHAVTGNEPLNSLWDRISRTGGTLLLAREHRPLLAVSIFALALNFARWSKPSEWVPGARAWFVLSVLVATLAVAAIPRPLQNAYFGPAFFGMTFFVAVASARLTRAGSNAMLALAVVIVAITGVTKLEKEWALLVRASDPQNWTGIVTHRIGQQLAEVATPGLPVATTHPLFALDGGLPIHKEFATGEFAWRSGALLGPERRKLLHSTSGEALADLLATRPAGAILLETDAKWDGPLVHWVGEAGWQEYITPDPTVRIYTP